jgi:hypothetical protein
MRSTILRRWLPAAAILVGLVPFGPGGAAGPAEGGSGFTPLFNGRNLTGWRVVLSNRRGDPKATFFFKGKVLVCTGRPLGYIFTERSYKNYVLRFDWRYPPQDQPTGEGRREGTSATLLHIQPPHRIWPKCVQVQGTAQDPGHVFVIGAKRGERNPPRFTSTVRADAREKAQKKASRKEGAWNTTEITSKDGSITSKLNGIPVDAGKGNLTQGPIGIQASGADVQFRNVMIKVLR